MYHEPATHWQDWREAVGQFGFCEALQTASRRLQQLDQMTPEQVERLFSTSPEMDSARKDS